MALLGNGSSGTYSASPSQFGAYQTEVGGSGTPVPGSSKFVGQPSAAAAGSVTYLEGAQVTASGVAVASFNIPVPNTGTPLAAGDLIVADWSYDTADTTVPTRTLPSGWTTITGVNLVGSATTTIAHEAAYHVVTSGEAGTTPTWTVTFTSGSYSTNCAASRFAGVDSTTPFAMASPFYAGTAKTTSSTTTIAPAVTTTQANAMLVTGVGIRNGSGALTSGPAGYTIGGNAFLGSGRSVALAHLTQAAAGASGTATWTHVTSTIGYAWQTALNPGPSSGGGGGGPTPTLVHQILGIPSGTDAAVSVRTTVATSVRLQVSTSSTFASGIISGSPVTPNAQGDSQLTVSGLTAGTSYYYRIGMTVSGTETFSAASTVPFKSAPTGQTSFAFSFAACANATDSASMAAIAARGDDLFLHLGDLYYADSSGTSLANFRAQMVAKIEATNHASVFSATPTSYSPSDHDGMNNDSTAGSDATAWTNWNAAYRELFPTLDLPGTAGVYRTFTWGRVRFIQLDTRSFASNPTDADTSAKTRLGATQKQWLKDTITAATEPAIVVIQDSVWHGTADPVSDDWLGHITERNELRDFFIASGKNIGMLGGDMHAVAADDGTNAAGLKFLFMAAPLNNTASQKGGPYTAGPYPASGTAVVQQYGRVVVTDNGSSIDFAFTGYSSDNTSRVTLTKTLTLASSATAAGGITLGGSSTTSAPVTAPGGGITLGGTATARAATTAAGSISLGGTATGQAPAATSGGGISLGGSATAQAPVTAAGSITLGGTATATGGSTAATASGSITIGASATARAAATAAGSITIGASATSQAPVTTAGGISLGGSATSAASATAAGSVTLGGSATSQAPTAAAGSVTLGGTATARAPITATGGISLGGTAATGGSSPASATGSVTLGGSVTARAAATSLTGVIVLGGSTTARAPVTAGGTIVLGGATTVAVPIGIAGLITLSGLANATAAGGDTYFPHVPVTATLNYTPGTAALAGNGIGTATLTAPTYGTAVLATTTPMTAALASDGTSTAALASNGVGTAVPSESYALADVNLV